ncbi:hypothetical protein [Microlunatus sp. GCM10028923]|uniref:hypothetical protein n=1 Tax=Microlunatus sp. GCM10028923 TaxID=3273400 RepID=UPI0036150C36
MTTIGPLAASDHDEHDGGEAPFTLDQVTAALAALPIAELRNGDAVSYPYPIWRFGLVWEVTIDLPAGLTPAHLRPHRAALSAGIGVEDQYRVFVINDDDPTRTDRAYLWVFPDLRTGGAA